MTTQHETGWSPSFELQMLDTAVPHDPRCPEACVETQIVTLSERDEDGAGHEIELYLPGPCDHPNAGVKLTVLTTDGHRAEVILDVPALGRMEWAFSQLLDALETRFGLVQVMRRNADQRSDGE